MKTKVFKILLIIVITFISFIVVVSTIAIASSDETLSLEDLKNEKIEVIKNDNYLSDSIGMIYLDRITECKTRECVEIASDEHINQSTKEFALDMMEKEKLISDWVYYSNYDQMTSDSVYYAQLRSKNYVQLDFPYVELNYADLKIRNDNKNNDVIVTMVTGQYSSEYNVSSWLVRFDDRKALRYNLSTSSNGNLNTRFINNESSFIKNIKESDSMLIEVDIYGYGNFTYKFKTIDLKWEH